MRSSIPIYLPRNERWSKQVLHRFDGPTDGDCPDRHLVFGADGLVSG